MLKTDHDALHRRNYSIYIGEVFASRTPAIVRTVLGSCISVCLYDPVAKVGGMNHFMLPHHGDDIIFSARYGVHSMELLINDCMKAGADRYRMQAKVFGGGHVLWTAEMDDSVPNSNIRFALKFLSDERITITSQDVGGNVAREVLFYTDTARALLKRLPCDRGRFNAEVAEIARKERTAIYRPSTYETANDDNVTLF
jgi:chemotaxis protein CheD